MADRRKGIAQCRLITIQAQMAAEIRVVAQLDRMIRRLPAARPIRVLDMRDRAQIVEEVIGARLQKMQPGTPPEWRACPAPATVNYPTKYRYPNAITPSTNADVAMSRQSQLAPDSETCSRVRVPKDRFWILA